MLNYQNELRDMVNAAIKRSGLKKKYIAHAIGISPVYFSAYLTGRCGMSERVLETLCGFLEMDIEIKIVEKNKK